MNFASDSGRVREHQPRCALCRRQGRSHRDDQVAGSRGSPVQRACECDLSRSDRYRRSWRCDVQAKSRRSCADAVWPARRAGRNRRRLRLPPQPIVNVCYWSYPPHQRRVTPLTNPPTGWQWCGQEDCHSLATPAPRRSSIELSQQARGVCCSDDDQCRKNRSIMRFLGFSGGEGFEPLIRLTTDNGFRDLHEHGYLQAFLALCASTCASAPTVLAGVCRSQWSERRSSTCASAPTAWIRRSRGPNDDGVAPTSAAATSRETTEQNLNSPAL